MLLLKGPSLEPLRASGLAALQPAGRPGAFKSHGPAQQWAPKARGPSQVGFLASWPNSGTVIITSESPVTAPALASARVPAAAAQSESAAAAPGRAAAMTQNQTGRRHIRL